MTDRQPDSAGTIMRFIINQTTPRRLHFMICAALLLIVSWALLSPDPFASIRHTRLSFLQAISDVILHCVAYTVFASACCSLLGANPDTRRRYLITGLLVVHAIGTELLQLYMPNRTCDGLDALANLSGIMLGQLLTSWALKHSAAVRA